MDERIIALDGGLPFGAMRLPSLLERFRIWANRLGRDPLSRRFASIARRSCIIWRPDPFDVNVFDRCRARLYPRSNRCERRVFLGVNSWDPDERAAIGRALHAAPAKRSFVFVDGGANVGLYSLFVASEARRIGRSAHIVAIEPDPVNLSRLRFNIAASDVPDAHVFGYALGERAEMGRLLSEQENRGEVRLARADEQGDSFIEVPVRPLPMMLAEAGVDHIDVLKLDIEGAEYPALRGLFSQAPQSLWPTMIVLEIGKRKLRMDAFQLCTEHGYGLAERTRVNAILRRPPEADILLKVETR
jgi:FkbM family methyltransferase